MGTVFGFGVAVLLILGGFLMAKKAAKELKATHKHEKSAIGNAWKVIFFGLGVSFAGFCLFAGMLISLETTP